MAFVRLSLLAPVPGHESELRHRLEQLDALLAPVEGLVFSMVISGEGRLGRLSVWLSREMADREATSERTLAVRSRIRLLAVEMEERLLEVESGWLPASLGQLASREKDRLHPGEGWAEQAVFALSD